MTGDTKKIRVMISKDTERAAYIVNECWKTSGAKSVQMPSEARWKADLWKTLCMMMDRYRGFLHAESAVTRIKQMHLSCGEYMWTLKNRDRKLEANY